MNKITIDGKTIEDLMGQKFTRLTVIEFGGFSPRGVPKWICRCDDGVITPPIFAANLKSGHTTSCGCLQAEITRQRSTIHGEARRSGRSIEFWAVAGMIQRCENTMSPHYDSYGGRGIWVCKALHLVPGLLAAIGRRPKDKKSLGRIDNDSGYTCGLCADCIEHGWILNIRWESHKEQMNNTRTSKHFNGKSVAEIATEVKKPIKDVRTELGLQNYG